MLIDGSWRSAAFLQLLLDNRSTHHLSLTTARVRTNQKHPRFIFEVVRQGIKLLYPPQGGHDFQRVNFMIFLLKKNFLYEIFYRCKNIVFRLKSFKYQNS